MNRKLMAAAVAGAFITPAFVFAQNATVQVYGRATVEYGYADQGNGRPHSDVFQTPGGGRVGFKGQEQLGGGMSAWFQCESSADIRGLNQDGFCTRNSGIGLKGGWGNLHFGRWDTPFKRAMLGMVGSLDTGLSGAAFTFSGTSTSTGALGGQGASQNLQRNVWKRRESGLIYYESPSFSGFQVLAAFSAANATGVTDATTNAKPRVGSISATYNNGPLNIGAGYEKHYNFGNGSIGTTTAAVTAVPGSAQLLAAPYTGNAGIVPVSAFTAPVAAVAGSSTTGTGNDDRGWTIGANYVFMGNLLVGVQYLDTKYESGPGKETKKQNWMVGGNWNFSGPHHILGAYVRAGDSEGNGPGISGGNGPVAAAGSDTGADFWELMYGYDFSKRTNAKFGYVHLSNDANARYSLGGLNTAPVAGTDQSAWVMYAQHTW